jgi:hypothetical protein
VTGRGRIGALCAFALLGFSVTVFPAACGKKAAPFLSRPLAVGDLEVTDVFVREGTVSIRFKVPEETFRLGKEEEPWSLVRLLRRRMDVGVISYVERSVIREAQGFTFGKSRTIVDAGVGAGRYLYRVELRKEKGSDRAESDPVSVDGAPLPGIGGDIAIEGREGAIFLRWAAPVEAPAGLLYTVYRRGRGKSGPISREPLTVTSFTDTRITREAEYCYQIQTAIQSGVVRVEGPRSREICASSVDRTPPPAPGGIRLMYVEGAFSLSWFPVESGDPAGYNIYRSVDRGPFVKVNTGLVAGTGYRDSDLEVGMEYGYRVTAVDDSSGANESPFSEVVKGEPPAR